MGKVVQPPMAASPRCPAKMTMDDDDDDELAEKIAALRALHASDKKGNELAAQLMSDLPAPPPKEVLKAVKPRPPRKEADMPRLESLPRREPLAKDAGTPRGNETLSRRDALAKALEATWLESADEKEARLLKAAQGTLAAPKAAHDDESKPSVQRARRRESSASRSAARPADDEATEREKEVARLAAGAAKLRLQLAATEKAKLEQERLKEVDQMYARLKEKEAAKRAAARYDFATIELVRAPTREDRDHEFAQFMRRERMKKEDRKRPDQ
ncbi:hypothetical protein Ctob_008786 [Chrysochromulina tobinii]|uniref:Uncharacterized protein n=1 Tax=Chrysochromulina tobinii TaxID=1460289 RepID=A0A0M0K5H4_9EUKA|nr:hypothetical protein Ctob_008786 [Chrysochromulina tobinii]|eukprot:KOO34111.1 hypothetical protein Ctob_008786 [Chrysochromulina sp. CCMP291]